MQMRLYCLDSHLQQGLVKMYKQIREKIQILGQSNNSEVCYQTKMTVPKTPTASRDNNTVCITEKTGQTSQTHPVKIQLDKNILAILLFNHPQLEN